MSYQNISVTLSPTEVNDIKAVITDLNSKLPFLVSLSPEERKTLIKLGPKSIDFVQDSSAAVQAFPGIVPGNFDIGEFQKDTDLFKVLTDLKLQLDSLTEKLDNTYLAVGNEAMTAALEVYQYVQTGANRTPGLKSVAEKLKERFKTQGRKKGIAPEPAA